MCSKQSISSFGLALFLFSSALRAAAVLVGSLPGLSANDSVSWSQLGPDGTLLGTTLSASSSSGIPVRGSLRGPNSQISIVCPASPSCSWAPATPGLFSPGDSLIWTSNGQGGGNGPLILSLDTPVFGAGIYIQANTPGSFIAEITAYNGTLPVLEGMEFSDNAGDPVFIGALDTTADITGEMFGLLGCGIGCQTSDFAVDSWFLNTTVPEPSFLVPMLALLATLLFAKHFKSVSIFIKSKHVLFWIVVSAMLVLLVTSPAFAQRDPSIPILDPSQVHVFSDQAVGRFLPPISNSVPATPLLTPDPGNLLLWSYEVGFYPGRIVGQSPFNHGARTTTVVVAVIPVIVNIARNGVVYSFDPTAEDSGCLGQGNTALTLLQESPLFNNADFTFNGIKVGNTQYTDAFMRAQFWQNLQLTGDSYHLLLSPMMMPAVTINVDAGPSGNATAAIFGFNGVCGSNSGTTNAPGLLGVLFGGVVENALETYIIANRLTASQFSFFITYGAAISNGAANDLSQCCTLGYHAGVGSIYPAPTFAIANFEGRNLFFGFQDIAAASHEIGEWMNDPYIGNVTPSWPSAEPALTGPCGYVLEVGDPLVGKLMPPVVMPNGFTYHLQELAFFSWFFGGPSLGAGGKYSSNGTFNAPAPPCQP